MRKPELFVNRKLLSVFFYVCISFAGLSLGPKTSWAMSPLKLVVENHTFAYNLEWVSIDTIAEGQTLIGNIFKTHFRYHFGSRFKVDAGVMLQHPFGDDDRIDEVDPIFTASYLVYPGWSIHAGTIDRAHPLHDAFFWETLRYTEPIEQGFQLKGNTKYWLQDLWISWDQNETLNRREKFSVGNVTRFRLKGFWVEGQLYWVHLGGQKNSGPGVFNNFSLGVGGGYTWKPKREQAGLSFLKQIGVSVHYLKNTDEPPGALKVDEDGVSVRFFTTLFDVGFYYLFWEGGSDKFNSPRGDRTFPDFPVALNPLAKGNPLYKAEDFQEFGVSKVWELVDSVFLRADLKAQWVLEEVVEVYSLSIKWREDFDLFEDFFKKRKRNLSS